MITSLLFFPEKDVLETPSTYKLPYEDSFFWSDNSCRLHAWYMEAKEHKGVLLFLHGNAGNISGRVFKAKGWVERGYSVLLLDYRGYGQSSGSIQRGEDLVQDAEAGVAWLIAQKGWKREEIVFYGESLGSHPAIRLACSSGKALILEAPFTAFTDLAAIHYPALPRLMTDALLKDFRFENLSFIGQVKTPVFIIHGTEDATCPYAMGEELFAQAPEPKSFFPVTHAGHNNLAEAAGKGFWDEPAAFLNQRSTV